MFSNEDIRYICQFCNKVFSRRVTLKKHLEVHEQSVDSDLSDNEVDDPSNSDIVNDDDDDDADADVILVFGEDDEIDEDDNEDDDLSEEQNK